MNIKDKNFCATADVPHIPKIMKPAVMKGLIFLVNKEQLPSKWDHGKYIKSLWEEETRAEKSFRFIHHLKPQDIYPDNFQKMHVIAVIRFFPTKIAAALETAVYLKLLPKEALMMTRFVRIIEEWLSTMNSKTRKTSIKKRNKGK